MENKQNEIKLNPDMGEQVIAKLKLLEKIIQYKFRRFEHEQELQDSSLARIRP